MKREKKVGSPYSPSKVLSLIEIGGMDHFFRLWKDQHVKKFLQEIADYITSKYMTKALKIWTYVIKTIDRASG